MIPFCRSAVSNPDPEASGFGIGTSRLLVSGFASLGPVSSIGRELETWGIF